MDASRADPALKRIITARAVVTAKGVIGDSILIENGAVMAIGAKDDLDRTGVPVTEYAATIIPGLRDAHIHPVSYAALLGGCSLKNSTDIKDLQRRLMEYADTFVAGKPIVATRIDDAGLAEQRLPTRTDLDEALPDRPVVVYRYCGHVAIANSAALRDSAITRDTPNPDGGSIDHDAYGNPTGVLRETAIGLIPTHLSWSGDPDEETLISALVGLAGIGITSIGAMMSHDERHPEQHEVALWQRVAKQLPIRVHGITSVETPRLLEDAATKLNGAGPRLSWLGLKRFADGSLGGHTAAMHAPFVDVESRGILRLSGVDTLLARRSIELGGMVAIHAIGDRAVDAVLDMFDDLISDGADPRDLRMEHVSVLNQNQVARFAALGVTAVVQPAFLASEAAWVVDRIGRDRASWLYPFQSLITAGAPMAGSSDCPVEPPQPLWGMAGAMDRCGMNAQERLTGIEALAMFTSGAALALREPEPLSLGSPADIVIIDADPTTASADEIRNAEVLDTYVDGIRVKVDRSSSVWPD
jgi:predicted amidohydrolase YtcJ